MNEELQKALGELLNKANNGIDAAGNFLAAEIPDVIQQLLMWHGVYNFIIFLIAFTCGLISSVLTIKILLNIGNKNHWSLNDKGDDLSLKGFMSIIVSAFLLLVFCININVEWLQIWIAPKVWLLEYAAKLAG